MKALAIFARELKSYFLSPVAYVVAAGFAVFTGISYYFHATDFIPNMAYARDNGLLDVVKQNRINYFVITPLLTDIGYILMLLIPIITMKLWTEEKRMRTDELLLTSPISVWTMVLGKYFAAVVFVNLLVAMTLIETSITFYYSSPDLGVTVSSYFAVFLFVASTVAIGLFTSTLTDNPIVASVSCLIIQLIMATLDQLGKSIGQTLGSIVGYLSYRSHMFDLFDGVVKSGDLIFFAGTIFFWLFLANQSIESSRWR